MPPFGFGLSIANLRGGGAAGPFVPVVLVQEDWFGIGNVANRTPEPISGGGFWRVNTTLSSMGFVPQYCYAVQQDEGIFRHSVTFTDVSIIAIVTPAYNSLVGNSPVFIWARTTPNPFAYPTNGYYVECNDPLSGSTPITLKKRISGADTNLGTSATDPTGQIVTFTVAGSTLTVKVGSTTVIQVTDASIATAGYWGYSVRYIGTDDGDAISTVGPITIQTAQAGGGGVTDGILLENGTDFLLLENGDFLLQG